MFGWYKRLVWAVLPVLTLALSAPAQAQVSLVTTRPGLGGPIESLDWGTLGLDGTMVPNPFTILSSPSAIPVIVSEPSNSFERKDQGIGWAGNFSPGDKLLWTQADSMTGDGNGPITLDFGTTGINAGGANIQANFYGPFTATLEALDSLGMSLGTVTVMGTSSGAADGSAPFLGLISSNGNDIHKLIFSVPMTAVNKEDFAINQFDFVIQAVPEPSSFVLGSVALVGLLGYTGYRRKNLAK